MKLYSKKLSSLEELKREQIRLEYEKLRHSSESLMPAKELGKKGNGSGRNFMSFVLDLLGSNSPLQTGITIAKPLIRLLAKRSKKNVFRFIKEVGGGYLKWKAIEMSFNGVKLFVKSQKANSERKARMDMH